MNFQENRTGSLFRKETKAICLTCFKGLTPNFIKTEYGTTIYIEIAEITDWEFSSARDFYGNRNGKLINKKRTKEFIY
jgi:putative transposase